MKSKLFFALLLIVFSLNSIVALAQEGTIKYYVFAAKDAANVWHALSVDIVNNVATLSSSVVTVVDNNVQTPDPKVVWKSIETANGNFKLMGKDNYYLTVKSAFQTTVLHLDLNPVATIDPSVSTKLTGWTAGAWDGSWQWTQLDGKSVLRLPSPPVRATISSTDDKIFLTCAGVSPFSFFRTASSSFNLSDKITPIRFEVAAPTALSTIKQDTEIKVISNDKALTLSVQDDKMIQIRNLTGALVSKTNAKAGNTYTVKLTAGIYFINGQKTIVK